MIHVNPCKGGDPAHGLWQTSTATVSGALCGSVPEPAFQLTGMAMTRILLGDDDVELCAMLSEYLQAEGFVVDAVHDGEAALERAQAIDYDLLLLDVMMPGRNGFDVLRALRPASALPVLILTARGDDVDSVLGLESDSVWRSRSAPSGCTTARYGPRIVLPAGCPSSSVCDCGSPIDRPARPEESAGRG